MVEIHPKLFVGNQDDYEQNVRFQPGWRIVHACREPYHREALGYRGRSAPEDNPEYLVAVRGDRLILNLIDADDPAYIPKEIMDRSLAFIEQSLGDRCRVLVHCNQGLSRGPSIGLLYLAAVTDPSGVSIIAMPMTDFSKFILITTPEQELADFSHPTGRLTAMDTSSVTTAMT